MNSNEKNNTLIKVENLSKTFELQAGFFSRKDKQVFAVNNISFKICRGETYGIVGESGCGKTTTARLLIKMYPATSGNIFYYKDDGTVLNVSELNKKESKLYQEKVKYVFQDPAKSLNPRMNVQSIITDGLKYSSKKISKEESYELAEKIIQDVGLKPEDLH